jgi:hypothetical protein
MRALHWLTPAAAALLTCVGCSGEAATATPARPLQEPGSYEVISNAPLEADLQAGGKLVKVRGQMSLYVHYVPSEAARGQIEVRTLDITFFDVPQEALSGRPPRRGRSMGLLSFSLPLEEESKQRWLKYVPGNHSISGDITMAAHFTQLDEVLPAVRPKEDDGDYLVSRTIPGQFHVNVLLGGAPPELSRRPGQGDFSGTATFPAFASNGVRIPEFKITIPDPPIETLSGPTGPTRVVRQLCLQPVSIKTSDSDTDPTGESLATLLNNAQMQWQEKAAVVFDVQPVRTVKGSTFKTLLTGQTGNEDGLLSQVDEQHCIEVFFIEDFIPANFYFGANSYAPAQPDAKVIVAEKPRDHNGHVLPLDPLVLAHELGHVMGLGHPLRAGGLFKSSSGTLMCAAKAGHPRPTNNSLANIQHLSNGLTSLQLQMTTAPADCAGNPTCGACP